jgi:hypothetical protein
MSWLPAFSRGGTVRAASRAAAAASSPFRPPSRALCGSGGKASGGTASGAVSMSACSRRFHCSSSGRDGAVPMIPVCGMPLNRTPGRCGEVASRPWKSQTALYPAGNRSVRKPPPFSRAKIPV